MNLETKMGLKTGALMLAMLLSAWSAHVRIRHANELSERILTQRIPVILRVRDAGSQMTASIRALESYVLFGVDQQVARRSREERRTRVEQATAELRQLQSSEAVAVMGRTADAGRLVQALADVARLAALEERVERLNETRRAEDVAAAYVLLQQDVLEQEQAVLKIVGEIATSQQGQSELEAEDLRRANVATLRTLWLAALLGAVVGGAFSFVLARHIVSAVMELVDRADAIAEGDLTGAALRLTRDDEIGRLARAMDRMQDSLRTIIGTVGDTAGSLTGSAVSMRSASDQIHRRIDQQSQQTQQAATAMQEMSASIAEVSRHTQSAAETARAAAETAREGGAIVRQMLGSMETIALAVTETGATVGMLGDDSKRISQIVTVIDEIARKTNLLALNAAIEAARAGEQGRGFAVVASEVRRLAESTAQATGEIGAMIHEIQERTGTAIQSMRTGTGTVEEGVATTHRAGEALERIIGMAERVDRMITQIAIAASQQATAADQSSASLDSIHSLSNENLTEMATTAAGIENLRGTAVRLERQVDRFQVAMA